MDNGEKNRLQDGQRKKKLFDSQTEAKEFPFFKASTLAVEPFYASY
jgi:hypothetical protein